IVLAIVFLCLYYVGMYVATVPNRNSPPAILLRESFRLGGKVRNRTLSNLSHWRSEEHTSELQSLRHLVCRLLLRSKENTSELQSLRHLVCRLLLRAEEQTCELQSVRHLVGRLLLGAEEHRL